MADVSGISTASGQGLAKSLTGGNNLGKEDFLKLLVTQLQNQDPLNPSDPTEFTAQLATFSSLEQLFTVNANLGKMAASSGDIERLSALGLIGKEVVSTSGDFRLGSDGVELGYRLEVPAEEVSLSILDGSGRAVAALAPVSTAAGDHFVRWNGTGFSGQKLPPGEYTLVAQAKAGDDSPVSTKSLVKGVVTGVDLGSAGSLLVSNAGDFQLKDVASVRNL